MSFNKVIVLGNLTRDIEVTFTEGGMAIGDASLALNHKRKDKEDNVIEETTFVDVTIFGKQAETAQQFLSKGNPVLIEGRLRQDRWETQEGEKRNKLKIICERFNFVGSKSNDTPKQNDSSSQNDDASEDKDIPF